MLQKLSRKEKKITNRYKILPNPHENSHPSLTPLAYPLPGQSPFRFSSTTECSKLEAKNFWDREEILGRNKGILILTRHNQIQKYVSVYINHRVGKKKSVSIPDSD